MFDIVDYDYHLPQARVAQHPLPEKDADRMLRLDRRTGAVSHHRFVELKDFLQPDDVLVINNTKVVPARLLGIKESGGRMEALILDYPGIKESDTTLCQCLIKASRGLSPGARLRFESRIPAEVVSGREGIYRIRFFAGDEFETLLYQSGRTPLPPYIHRNGAKDADEDRTGYQTVYAAEKGAVAAPTAGLHFTTELLAALERRQVVVVPITLHVGYGTFSPVRVTDIRQHRMHRERFEVRQNAADHINQAVSRGGRVVAVGTTVVRVLEYLIKTDGRVTATRGDCDLFIYPGFAFSIVDAMITNFHLPRSTLLMLVSAFAGRESVLNAYQEAIREKYRFYSYGDAMYIT